MRFGGAVDLVIGFADVDLLITVRFELFIVGHEHLLLFLILVLLLTSLLVRSFNYVVRCASL